MTNANSAGSSSAPATETSTNPDPVDPKRLTFVRLAYGIYAWLEFTVMALLGLLILLILPGLTRRRRIVRSLARFALRLAGMPLTLTGLAEMPIPCIVVANHCSY